MPEINSKRNRQSGNPSKNPKKKKKSPRRIKVKSSGTTTNNHSRKKSRLITGDSITWKSTAKKKEKPRLSNKQWYFLLAGAVFLFLFVLWAFVPDRQTLRRRAAERKAEEEYKKQRAEKHEELSKKSLGFHHAQLLNSSSFSVALKDMHEGEFDRIMLVAFDDSTREAEANPFKVKLFKKCESLAKALPRKPLFKRYDEEDLPLVILFDCGNPNDPAAENVCKQIIGDNIPNQLIFRTQQQPRQLPNDYKSQKQILQYLYNLMQPAVKYLEELIDAEDFVADDSRLNSVLFGTDASGTYDQVADMLRDYAHFGRTKNPSIVAGFDLDAADLPSLLIWRTFGENPQIFTGNLSHAESVRNFVMNNYLPIFGEFTPKTSKQYMKRGLPILWIAYDPAQESIDLPELLSTSEAMAHQYLGHLTFTQLDVQAQPQIASNFGLDVARSKDDEDDEEDDDDDGDDERADGGSEMPQAFIMNQIAQVQEVVDMDDIEASIQKVIETYMRTLRAQRGELIPELQEDMTDYYGDDTEIEDDDEEENDDFLEDDDDDDDDDDDEEVDLADEDEQDQESAKPEL